MSPAIVWQSRQSQPQIEALLTRGMGPAYESKTGLVPDAYFTASKLAWLLEDEPTCAAGRKRESSLPVQSTPGCSGI